MENKNINLQYHVKEKLKACANYYAKAHELDKYLTEYFKNNNIYDDIKADYENLIIDSNSYDEFIKRVKNLVGQDTKNVTYNNETHSLREWARILELPANRVIQRYKKHSDDLDYVFSSANYKHKGKHFVEYNNETHSLTEWSKITGINYMTLMSRYNKNPRDLDYVFRKKI